MVPAILLAGGASTRMGRPKALLPVDGETFVSHLVGTLAAGGVDDIVVVLGHDASTVRPVVAGFDAVGVEGTHGLVRVRLVENPAPARGQLSSLQAGLLAVDRPGVQGALVTLVDVPLVSADTVRAVLAAHGEHSTAAVIRPVDVREPSRHGHPVLFARRLFEPLLAADVSLGAKPVIRAHASALLDVPVSDEGAFLDIDTPEEYERLVGPWPGKSA